VPEGILDEETHFQVTYQRLAVRGQHFGEAGAVKAELLCERRAA
jgi:hypothetical protein